MDLLRFAKSQHSPFEGGWDFVNKTPEVSTPLDRRKVWKSNLARPAKSLGVQLSSTGEKTGSKTPLDRQKGQGYKTSLDPGERAGSKAQLDRQKG